MENIQAILESCKVLKGWGGCDVELRLDEVPKDIWMLIKYSDHGDEYLVVGTTDKKIFRYGCFANLKWYKYMEFIRKPELFRKLDDRGIVSNTIFFELENKLRKSPMSFGYDKKYSSKEYAQYVFDGVICFICRMADTADAFFDYEDRKGNILVWLELNGIANEDNIKKLNDTAFHNKRKDKTIGISGKEDISTREVLVVDDVEFIYINDHLVKPDKVLTNCYTDEWGFDSKRLCLKGFRPSKARA